MRSAELNSAILRFFTEDIGGILITDEDGNILYEDEKTEFVKSGKTNWKAACPLPSAGQRGETWDLLHSDTEKTYMVTTSTFTEHGAYCQIHHLTDTSLYMELYRDITDYSKSLKNAKERDGMTGLYNKGKLMELKQSLFRKQETIAVFNMDVNNLKHMNDHFGHEAGDRLIMKAAESMKRIESRNVMAFRTGGDEFVVIALHVSRDEAEMIRKKWEEGLAELNRRDDGINCVIACGFAYAEKGYNLDAVFAQADEKMYENKKEIKTRAGLPLTR